ncbi:MAG: NAD-dependent epimerase/dehydratase family protein, partial [Qingshengfaniella sp.]
MRLGITGGTGLVGRFIVRAALSWGWHVHVLSRHRAGLVPGAQWHPYDLADPAPRLPTGLDALIHAAFDHQPGRYRGGEGDDPAGFLRRNLDGSLRLFAAARASGVARVLFLSSRAVFGGYPSGTSLSEDLPPHPDTLYGQAKHMAEQGLADLAAPGFAPITLRATGVYGPSLGGGAHKWTDLFRAWHGGETVAPRRGSEVHGADLADGVYRLLGAPAPPRIAHASDLLLDHRDLLTEAEHIAGPHGPLPDRTTGKVSLLECAALTRLGWRPGGMGLLHRDLPGMLA